MKCLVIFAFVAAVASAGNFAPADFQKVQQSQQFQTQGVQNTKVLPNQEGKSSSSRTWINHSENRRTGPFSESRVVQSRHSFASSGTGKPRIRSNNNVMRNQSRQTWRVSSNGTRGNDVAKWEAFLTKYATEITAFVQKQDWKGFAEWLHARSVESGTQGFTWRSSCFVNPQARGSREEWTKLWTQWMERSDKNSDGAKVDWVKWFRENNQSGGDGWWALWANRQENAQTNDGSSSWRLSSWDSPEAVERRQRVQVFVQKYRKEIQEFVKSGNWEGLEAFFTSRSAENGLQGIQWRGLFGKNDQTKSKSGQLLWRSVAQKWSEDNKGEKVDWNLWLKQRLADRSRTSNEFLQVLRRGRQSTATRRPFTQAPGVSRRPRWRVFPTRSRNPQTRRPDARHVTPRQRARVATTKVPVVLRQRQQTRSPATKSPVIRPIAPHTRKPHPVQPTRKPEVRPARTASPVRPAPVRQVTPKSVEHPRRQQPTRSPLRPLAPVGTSAPRRIRPVDPRRPQVTTTAKPRHVPVLSVTQRPRVERITSAPVNGQQVRRFLWFDGTNQSDQQTADRQSQWRIFFQQNRDALRTRIQNNDWAGLALLLQQKSDEQNDGFNWTQFFTEADGATSTSIKNMWQTWATSGDNFDFGSWLRQNVSRDSNNGFWTRWVQTSSGVQQPKTSRGVEIQWTETDTQGKKSSGMLRLKLDGREDQIRQLVLKQDWSGLVKFLNSVSEQQGGDWSKVFGSNTDVKTNQQVGMWRTILSQWAAKGPNADFQQTIQEFMVNAKKGSVKLEGRSDSKNTNQWTQFWTSENGENERGNNQIQMLFKLYQDDIRKIVETGNWEALIQFLNEKSREQGQTGVNWVRIFQTGSNDSSNNQRALQWQTVVKNWAENVKSNQPFNWEQTWRKVVSREEPSQMARPTSAPKVLETKRATSAPEVKRPVVPHRPIPVVTQRPHVQPTRRHIPVAAPTHRVATPTRPSVVNPTRAPLGLRAITSRPQLPTSAPVVPRVPVRPVPVTSAPVAPRSVTERPVIHQALTQKPILPVKPVTSRPEQKPRLPVEEPRRPEVRIPERVLQATPAPVVKQPIKRVEDVRVPERPVLVKPAPVVTVTERSVVIPKIVPVTSAPVLTVTQRSEVVRPIPEVVPGKKTESKSFLWFDGGNDGSTTESQNRREAWSIIFRESGDELRKYAQTGNWEEFVKLLQTKAAERPQSGDQTNWRILLEQSEGGAKLRELWTQWAKSGNNFNFSEWVQRNSGTANGQRRGVWTILRESRPSQPDVKDNQKLTVEITKTDQVLDTEKESQLEFVIRFFEEDVKNFVRTEDWQGLATFLNTKSRERGTNTDWSAVLSGSKDSQTQGPNQRVLVWRQALKRVANGDAKTTGNVRHIFERVIQERSPKNGNVLVQRDGKWELTGQVPSVKAPKQADTSNDLRVFLEANGDDMRRFIQSNDWEGFGKLMQQRTSQSGHLNGIDWTVLFTNGGNNEGAQKLKRMWSNWSTQSSKSEFDESEFFKRLLESEGFKNFWSRVLKADKKGNVSLRLFNTDEDGSKTGGFLRGLWKRLRDRQGKKVDEATKGDTQVGKTVVRSNQNAAVQPKQDLHLNLPA